MEEMRFIEEGYCPEVKGGRVFIEEYYMDLYFSCTVRYKVIFCFLFFGGKKTKTTYNTQCIF